MSGIYSLYNISQGSMWNQNLLIRTISNNINNVNTEGYHRQRVDMSYNGSGLASEYLPGFTSARINSQRNNMLEAQIRKEASFFGAAKGEQTILASAEVYMNEIGQAGISQAMQDFQQSLQDLAAGTADRSYVIKQAANVGKSFKQTMDGLLRTQKEILPQIADNIQQVNDQAAAIANLNKSIKINAGAGKDVSELLDERSRLIKKISETVRVEVVAGDGLDLALQLPGGQNLVDGELVGKISLKSGDGKIALDFTSAAGNTSAMEQPEALSGQLGGLIRARDVTLEEVKADLDTLAYSFVEKMNEIHAKGYDAYGDSGNPLFNSLGSTKDAARNISVAAPLLSDADRLAVATDCEKDPTTGKNTLTGDFNNAIAMGESFSSEIFSGPNKTFLAYYRGMVGKVGSALHDAEQDASNHEFSLSQLNGYQQAESGVSMDEELIELSKAQHAFEATAKLIKTADELFAQIIALKT